MMRLWFSRVSAQLTRIRTRLLLVNLLIVSVPIVGIGFARFYEREMLRSLEDDMIHQAQIVRALLPKGFTDATVQEQEPALAAAARHTRAHIRLLSAEGQVLADSHYYGAPEGQEPPRLYWAGRRESDPPAEVAEGKTDLSSRPEVRTAMAGKYGSNTRVWRWQGGDRVYLFSALPVVRSAQVRAVVYVTRSTLPVLDALYRLRTTLLWVLAGAVAATSVLSLFLAGTIARPLARLARLTQRVAQGDRTVNLALGRRDEIGHLASAIAVMARRLDERAQHAARLAADISHEFKSPLTGIRGAAELLLDGAAEEPATRTRFLQNVLDDAGRLDRLVSRLLELSRLEADEAPVQNVDCRLMLEEIALEKVNGPRVEVTFDPAAPRGVWARQAALASALRNLIENAQQHARPGSLVRVEVTAVANHVAPASPWLRVCVSNEGEQISPSNLARVWDRFFTTRADRGGSGLGLPIVASVVASHGGSVFAESTTEATRFGFDLPA